MQIALCHLKILHKILVKIASLYYLARVGWISNPFNPNLLPGFFRVGAEVVIDSGVSTATEMTV